MKRTALLVVAALLAACSEIPSGPYDTDPAIAPAFIEVEPAYSPGCFDLQNNATDTWDRLYDLVEFSGTFTAGEVISVSAGYPVTDVVPVSLFFTEIVANEPFPGTLTYTIPADGVYTMAWGVNIGDATWAVTCSPPAVNTAPLATNDAYTTDEDASLNVPAAGVLENDTDDDGDALAAALVAGPANGSLTLNADGSFTYTPDIDFNGSDTFTYLASDGLADSNVATVDITVHPVNDAPVATDDAYTTDENVPLIVAAPDEVLANDADADGDALTSVLVTGPLNGSLALNADGSFTYTPDLGYHGPDAFTYKANDGTADSNVATVSITVNRVIHATIVIGGDRKDAPNTINTKSNGLVAVAILGDPGEFALPDIDWTSLAFGPGVATVAHDLSDAATWSGHVMDVNGDGIPDLVTHYSQKATGLLAGDTEACLTGMIDGVAVEACGAVIVR